MNHNDHVENIINEIDKLVDQRIKDIESLCQIAGGWEKWFQCELICQLRRNYAERNTSTVTREVYGEVSYPHPNQTQRCDIVITHSSKGKELPYFSTWIELKCMGLNMGWANNKGSWTESSIDAWCRDVVKDRQKIQTLDMGGIALLMVPDIGEASIRAISNMKKDGWGIVGELHGITLLGFDQPTPPIVID